MMKAVLIFFVLIIPSFVYAAGVADYSAVPLFLNIQVKPNVLIILDDSNSMDEDFMGNAVGSYAANSKAVAARDVLLGLINSYKDKMRIGLMGYRVGSSVSSSYIHNWYYFGSYQPKSYCPDPPPECVEYCQTNDSSARTTCQTACQTQNAAFDVDYFDEIITNYSIGSANRNKYCRLCYPKIQRIVNPTDSSNYLYYKRAGPFYSGSNSGTMFLYSSSYNANDSPPTSADSYNQYRTKTGTADDETGYSNSQGSRTFAPIDSDFALGYWDFGRRAAWTYVGRTWFKNSSPGGGYIHVPVNNVAGSQLTNLLNKLSIQDATGYMSCTASDKDTCSYIINAGLTPIAGTLEDAREYFTGGSTPLQYPCQKNFIIFVTDGLPSVDKSGAKNLTDPDALMPEVLSELDSLREITVTVGGESKKFDVKTYVVGVALTDEAKTKLDNMAVEGGTAVNGRAFYADNPTKLEESLNTIFADVVKRTASASAVSVLSTSAEGEGGLFQAYFTPALSEGPKDVTWIGYLQFLFMDQYGNIREDTASPNKLVLANDNIIRFRVNAEGDTVVDRYEDTDGNGEVDGGPVGTVLLSDMQPLWEGGKNLALRTSERTIYTYKDDEWIPFTVSYADVLRPYLNVDTTDKARDIIKFIRGGAATDCTVLACRDRGLTVNGEANKVWKLGDIVYSTPTVVGRPLGQYHLTYGDTSYLPFIRTYKDRKTVVYVGGNDGMLHAFSAGYYHEGDDSTTTDIENGWYTDDAGDMGQETWGYIPYNLLPHLQWFTDTNYTKDIHVYYVDLKPKVEDVRIFSDDGDHPKKWGTILIGGMRLGGGELTRTDEFISGTPETRTFRSAFFALDVTKPASTAYPKLLWEYTDADLGFTTSYPAIARIEDGGTGKWFAIVGSGPAGPEGLNGGSDQNGYIYVIDLSDGTATKINTGLANAFMTSPITIDLGLDNSVNVVYIGATYNDAGVWKGKIFRLETGGNTVPSTWTLSTFINLEQPVTAAPSAVLDPFGHLWLYWGTGRYLSAGDKAVTLLQRLYGAWDPRAVIDPTGVPTDPLQVSTDLVNVTDIIVYEEGYTNTTGTMFQDVLNTVRSKKGWYVIMPAGERSFVKPTVIGDIVLFPVFKPNTDVCGYGGDSYLYALYYETGTAYWKPIIGFGPGTIETYKEIRKKTTLGPGLPTGVVIHSGQQEGVKGMIQLGTGVVEEINITPATSPQSRVLFWREKMQ